MQVTTLEREFLFNNQPLPDPNPAFSLREVAEHFAVLYPELTSSNIEQLGVVDGKQQFKIARAVGTKG